MRPDDLLAASVGLLIVACVAALAGDMKLAVWAGAAGAVLALAATWEDFR